MATQIPDTGGPVAAAGAAAAEPAEKPRESYVRIAPAAAGGTEFLFPAARNPGAAVGATSFLLLFAGFFAFFVHLIPGRAGLFMAAWMGVFAAAFGVFCLILLWASLALWLQVTRVVVGAGRVAISDTLLGLRATRSIALAGIAAIQPRIGMQVGSTPYYDIAIVRHGARPVTAGRGIRDKREAEWLALEMTRHLA